MAIAIYHKDAEIKLVEMLTGIRDDSLGWRMMHFHFSQLLDHYKSDYQNKITLNLIKDHVREFDGGVFLCDDYDVVVIIRGINKGQVEQLLFRLRYLFSDDPLAYNAESQENENFCTIRDLSVGWHQAQELAKMKLIRTARKSSILRPIAMPGSAPQEDVIRPLTPARLVGLENDIAKADFSRVVRRQPVCAIKPGKQLTPVFDEMYIHIGHLRRITLASVDFTSNRWLFKYLTEMLDLKMLDLLAARDKEYLTKPFSINLNIQTVFGDAFARFDDKVPARLKSSVVIEIQLSDVFTDMRAFMAARDNVQRLGYKVCLDGMGYLSFLQVDRKSLGFDLAKLQWNADMKSDVASEENQQLKAAIDRCGTGRIILCHCDNENAVDFGNALGVSLFQGRYVDNLVNPAAKVVN